MRLRVDEAAVWNVDAARNVIGPTTAQPSMLIPADRVDVASSTDASSTLSMAPTPETLAVASSIVARSSGIASWAVDRTPPDGTYPHGHWTSTVS